MLGQELNLGMSQDLREIIIRSKVLRKEIPRKSKLILDISV